MGKPTFSATLSESNSAPIWNRKPKRVRTSTSARSARLSIRRPSTHTSPWSGRSRPTMCLSITLLPVPDAPMTTRDWPFSIIRVSSFSTTRLPKRLETLRSSMKAIVVVVVAVVLPEQAAHAVNREIPVLQQLREEEIQHDDRDEALHEALRARAADAAGAAAAGEALVATDQPDGPAEEEA